MQAGIKLEKYLNKLSSIPYTCHIAGTNLAEAVHLDRTRKLQKDNKFEILLNL